MNRSLLFSLLNTTAIMHSPDGPAGGGGGGEPAGGGSSTPSSAPSTPTSSSDAAPASSSPSGDTSSTPASDAAPAPLDDPFGGFEGDTGDEDDAPPPPQAPPLAPAAEAKPPVAPQTPPAQQPAPSGEQQAMPPQPAAPGPQEAPSPQLPTPAEPAKMSAALLRDVKALSEHLATTPEFALSEEDIEAINNDITTAIPKISARVFVRAQASALAQMERVIPAMVERYMKVSQAREASAGKFYARWPAIDRAAHASTVDRLAAQYRQANPQATLEQMVEELGPIVMMVAKIPLQPASQTPPQQQAANGGHPQAPRRPPSSPFVPAVGGPASPPAAQAQDDPWGGYGAAQDDE